MSSVPRATWVKLYKDLLRASNNFPQYNYKLFARRRVRDYFEVHRKDSPEQLEKLYEEGCNTLKIINRQVALSKSFPQPKLVVEEPVAARV